MGLTHWHDYGNVLCMHVHNILFLILRKNDTAAAHLFLAYLKRFIDDISGLGLGTSEEIEGFAIMLISFGVLQWTCSIKSR